MNERSILDNGTIIELYVEDKNGRQPREYHIAKLVSDRGASTVAYRAFHENSSNIGILREYYPMKDDIVLDRDEHGCLKLDMSPESEAERMEYLQAKERYLKPFTLLRNMRRKMLEKDPFSFIPSFEICYGSADAKQDDGTVYIWTPAPQTETFAKICNEIHNCPADEPEYKLYMVLNAVYSLTQCVAELHDAGLIHRDIKPDNFGFDYRKGEILTQSISMFDVDSICKAYPAPAEDMGTKGFMEDESERKNDGLRDIYSIGATLFYSIIITDRTKESDYRYQNHYFDEIPDLVKSSKLISSSDHNSYPRLRSCLTKILRKCLSSRYSREESTCRYKECEELAAELRTAIGYVIPLELSRRATGERWVLQDAKKWLSDMEEKNSKLSLQYHLYKHPLYQHLGDGDDLSILILGFGRFGFKFLDLALQLSQNIGRDLNVTVVSDSKMDNDETDKNLYLEERPEITRFFDITGKDPVHSPYGKIDFRSECLTENEDDLNIKSDSVKSLIRQGRYDYVFIDFNNNGLNIGAARIVKASGCLGVINYISEGHMEAKCDSYDEIIPVKVSESVRDSADFAEIERMAFNAHLVWNDNTAISYAVKKAEFMQEYNYESCVSNVLAIKYKLWRMGIDLDRESVYESAGKIEDTLKNNPEERQYLTWLEHRRWVTEKICDGWVGRSIEECERIADVDDDVTRDKQKKAHVCIVRSNPEWSLDGLDTGKWDSNGIDTSSLDELDKLSVELHRFYERQASKMSLGEFEAERGQLIKTSAFSCFEEWTDAKREMLKNRDRKSASAVKAAWIRLKEAIENDKSGEITAAQKKNIIEALERSIRPFFNQYEYKDYKKIDVDLIDKIPYILTYTHDIHIIYPMNTFDMVEKVNGIDVSSEFVFSHAAAATILNPSEITYLYYAPERSGFAAIEEPSRLDNVIRRIIAYKKRKGLRAKVKIIIFIHSEGTKALYALPALDRNDITVEYVLMGMNGTPIASAELCMQELAGKGTTLLEDTRALSTGWLSGSNLKRMASYYRFDSSSRTFTDANDCGWVRYVNNNMSINARDIAELSGRKYSFDETLDFGIRENTDLWIIYKNDSSRWKRCSMFLAKSENHLEELLSCRKEDVGEGQVGTYKFFMPAESFASLKVCVNALVDDKLIGSDSEVYLCSETVCCLAAKCTGKMRTLIDRMLSKPYAFVNPNELKITPFRKSNTFSIHFNGLSVSEIDLKASIEDLAQKNQINNKEASKEEAEREIKALLTQFHGKGFIHNLSTKGSIVGFTYGSQTIKNLMQNSGNILELRVYQELIQMQSEDIGQAQFFDDVVGGITFENEREAPTEQIDCLVLKGFRSLIIECKARDGLSREDINEYVEKLGDRVKKYGIGSKGLLLIDSRDPIPVIKNDSYVIIKRVDDIAGDDKNKIASYVKELVLK